MEASVKIMLSYDCCHFEVCLSREVENDKEANELRKIVQRIADKAVCQYKKKAKEKEYKRVMIIEEKK